MKASIFYMDRNKPDERQICLAAQAIRKGELVAFPTETVYGLGANALDAKAVLGIFKAKGRPADNPLIAHVASIEEVGRIADITDLACILMKHFWPGPLTLILKAKDVVPSEMTGGLSTVAVRMPSNTIALKLIESAGVPIAGPSANRSGRPSPTDAASVYEDLGDKVSIILDSGATEVGLESTVIDVTGNAPVLLRPGGLPIEEIERVAGKVLLPEGQNEKRRSPGTRYRHYAPLVPLVLWEKDSSQGEFLYSGISDSIGFLGIHEPPFPVNEKILFPDLEAYARGLFTSMRTLEKMGITMIIAEFPEEHGVGLALRDRLRRAAGAERSSL